MRSVMRSVMRTNVIRATVLAAVATGIVGVASASRSGMASPQQKPEPAVVTVDNFTFGPGTLTVPVGTTVTWTNRDDIPHTVVSTERAFKSKVLDTNEKFAFTFGKAGSYRYFCSIHPRMTGTVVVR